MSEAVRTSTIELEKEAFKFSAGHFTIFSAAERERLHGHNFTVSCALTGVVRPDGLIADYGAYKQAILRLCRAWDEVMLLPARSPHLDIQSRGDEVIATFAGQRMVFPRDDVLLLPVANISLEELSASMLDALLGGELDVERDRLTRVVVRVSSGPGQWASARWDEADGRPRRDDQNRQ